MSARGHYFIAIISRRYITFIVFAPAIFQTRSYRATHGTVHYYDNCIFDKFSLAPRATAADDRIPCNNRVSNLFMRPINSSWSSALSRKIARSRQRPAFPQINEKHAAEIHWIMQSILEIK